MKSAAKKKGPPPVTEFHLIDRFMMVTSHTLKCALVEGEGRACTCGQVEALRAVRQEAARWLEGKR
jgi:hypothetical protein